MCCWLLRMRALLLHMVLVPWSLQETTKQPPLVWSRASTNVTVEEGESFTLDCFVSNRATEDTILWKHESQVLQADHIKVRVDDNLEITMKPEGASYKRGYHTGLRVRQANTDYAGRYLCVVEWNTRDEPVQVEFRVNIIIPPTIEAASRTVEKREGETAELACIAGGSPQPNVSWHREGVHMKGEDRPIVTLHNLSRQDSGVYTCRAENGAKKKVEASVRLTVQYAPRVTALPPELVVVRADRTVALSCRVDALPPAKVAWYNRQGMLVMDKYPASSNSTHHSLRLRRVQESELGAFTCIGRNSLGEDRATVLLSGRPSEVRINRKTSITTQNTIELHWTTTSFSPVEISTINFRKSGYRQWESHLFRHPQEAQGFSHLEREWNFLIRNLQASTQYEVEVTSRNKHGGSNPSNIVRISTRREGYTEHDRHTLGEENRGYTWGTNWGTSGSRYYDHWLHTALIIVMLLLQ